MEPSGCTTSSSVTSADPMKVPVDVLQLLMLNVIITFSPTGRGGPAKLKQGKNSPLAGRGGPPASALGNVNAAPRIASAQKIVRRCDRKRFCLNQQFVFIQTSKGTGNQSSGIFFWKFAPVRLTRIARIVTNFIRLESPAGNFGSRLVRIREIRVCIFRLVAQRKNGHAIGGGIGSLAAGVYHHTVGVLSLRG